jgi:LytR cell envelope-related transcriptional attenuator
LVVVAGVVVGALVLANVSSSQGLSTKTTATTRPPATTTTATTAAAAVHEPASVNVLVLNGVDPKKVIAKPVATAVGASGFATLQPRDATRVVTASAVYFLPGYQADAAKVAAVLSLPPGAVVALPTPVPPEIGDLGGAHVVVVVGPDAPAASG